MLNQCILIGRLTSDPDFKLVNEGVPLTRFTLAVERNYTKNGEREVDYPHIIVWRGLAEHCAEYLQKGSMVAVVGRYQQRLWTDEAGEKKKSHEFIAENVRFLAKTKRKDLEEIMPEDENDGESPF